MRESRRTVLCGGRSAMSVPTAIFTQFSAVRRRTYRSLRAWAGCRGQLSVPEFGACVLTQGVQSNNSDPDFSARASRNSKL